MQQILYALVLHVGKLLYGVVLVTVRRTFPEGYVERIWNLANASIVILDLIGSPVRGELVAQRIVLVMSTLVIDASLGHGIKHFCATTVGVQRGVFVSSAV